MIVHLAFKFYATNTVRLNSSKINLINQYQIPRKNCIEKGIESIKCLIRCYFSGSNTFAFIEDLRNQINNAVFNHNCYI